MKSNDPIVARGLNELADILEQQGHKVYLNDQIIADGTTSYIVDGEIYQGHMFSIKDGLNLHGNPDHLLNKRLRKCFASGMKVIFVCCVNSKSGKQKFMKFNREGRMPFSYKSIAND